MTDALCKRCMERKVRVADIIQAGGSADRYLVCIQQVYFLFLTSMSKFSC